MKFINYILLIVFFNSLVSCQNNQTKSVKEIVNSKSKETITENFDQIIFGKFCGFCPQNCAIMYRYNMIGNQNSFSADFTDSYFKNNGELKFDTNLNDQKYYTIASDIVKHIPEILLTENKETERFGCPDCADGCGIYFETTKNGIKKKFYIDYQTTQLEGEIKEFADYLTIQITKLESMSK